MAWQPDYLVGEEFSDYEQIADDVDDVQLAWAVTAASRAVDDGTNRQFGLLDGPEQRFYTPWWSPSRGRWVITVDDVQTAVGLAIHLDLDGDDVYTDLITDPVRKLPMNAAAENRPWEHLVLPASLTYTLTGAEYEVGVTARWGWTEVQPTIKQATAMQAARFLARRNAPFGIAGSPDAGSEMRLLARLDPDVLLLLKNRKYWRPRTGVR